MAVPKSDAELRALETVSLVHFLIVSAKIEIVCNTSAWFIQFRPIVQDLHFGDGVLMRFLRGEAKPCNFLQGIMIEVFSIVS